MTDRVVNNALNLWMVCYSCRSVTHYENASCNHCTKFVNLAEAVRVNNLFSYYNRAYNKAYSVLNWILENTDVILYEAEKPTKKSIADISSEYATNETRKYEKSAKVNDDG